MIGCSSVGDISWGSYLVVWIMVRLFKCSYAPLIILNQYWRARYELYCVFLKISNDKIVIMKQGHILHGISFI